MADGSFVRDDIFKDPEHQFSQSPTLGEQGNPSGRERWLNGYAESNDGQPDDLAESIFSSQEEEEEEEDNTADVTAEEPAFPPLATGIHLDFLARHATDLSLLDQPPAGAATEAVSSFGVPNLPWNNVQDFSGPMLLQDIQANDSEENEVLVSRPNPPVEHCEGGGYSCGILADDNDIHRLMSESCGRHVYLPACGPLDDLIYAVIVGRRQLLIMCSFLAFARYIVTAFLYVDKETCVPAQFVDKSSELSIKENLFLVEKKTRKIPFPLVTPTLYLTKVVSLPTNYIPYPDVVIF